MIPTLLNLIFKPFEHSASLVSVVRKRAMKITTKWKFPYIFLNCFEIKNHQFEKNVCINIKKRMILTHCITKKHCYECFVLSLICVYVFNSANMSWQTLHSTFQSGNQSMYDYSWLMNKLWKACLFEKKVLMNNFKMDHCLRTNMLLYYKIFWV